MFRWDAERNVGETVALSLDSLPITEKRRPGWSMARCTPFFGASLGRCGGDAHSGMNIVEAAAAVGQPPSRSRQTRPLRG
jgi:hypothetical protein